MISFLIGVVLLLYLIVVFLNPNIEKNYETGHYILFYDDFLRNFSARNFIQLPFKFKKDESEQND
jgi:hypothetical protein